MQDDFDGAGPEEDENPFDARAYKVGYGKPPVEHRFKEGNKAAAGRRKKKSKSVRIALTKALEERVTAVVNGKRKRMTQGEALVRWILARSSQSVPDTIRLLKFAMEIEPDLPLEPSDLPKLEVSFVTRDWSDDPLPGHHLPLREQERRREEGEE